MSLFLMSGGQIFVTSQVKESSPLTINEFLTANLSGLSDEDGDYPDWIEIYNRSDQPVNLSGWSLTDELDRPNKWTFPNLTLDSHDYVIVFASGKNRKVVEPGSRLHTNFKLSITDRHLALHNVLDGRFMDVVDLQDIGYLRDVAYGRAEGTLGFFAVPSPGQPNQADFIRPEEIPPVAVFDEEDSLAQSQPSFVGSLQEEAARDSQMRITEIMYHPKAGNDYEFIELKNIGQTPLDISGAAFVEGIEFTFRYGIPPLAPGQLILLVNNESAIAERYPGLRIDGVYDGNLSNRGEQVTIRDIQGNILASVTYDDENGWPISADGLGDSLVLRNLTGDPNNPLNWRASSKIDGSPGISDHITVAMIE